MTMMVVEPFNSVHVGHEHFFNSSIVSCQYSARRRICPCHHAKAKIATTITKTIIVVLFTIFSSLFRFRETGGEGGIRTPVGLSPKAVFRPAAIAHYAISGSQIGLPSRS